MLLGPGAVADRFLHTLFSPAPRPRPHTEAAKSLALLVGSTMHLSPRPVLAPHIQCQYCQRPSEDPWDQPSQPLGRDKDLTPQNLGAQFVWLPDTSAARRPSRLPESRHES